jgi:hypothetical protein
MNKKMSLAFLCTFAANVLAQEAFVSHANSHYEGWVQSRDGVGGRYEKPVAADKDWRAAHPAFFVDKPYQSSFLTAQEEAAYRAELMFRTRKPEQAELPMDAVRPFIAAQKFRRRFAKRGMVVRSQGGFKVVCAPAIAAADMPTWRDALKCWDVLKKEVSHD